MSVHDTVDNATICFLLSTFAVASGRGDILSLSLKTPAVKRNDGLIHAPSARTRTIIRRPTPRLPHSKCQESVMRATTDTRGAATRKPPSTMTLSVCKLTSTISALRFVRLDAVLPFHPKRRQLGLSPDLRPKSIRGSSRGVCAPKTPEVAFAFGIVREKCQHPKTYRLKFNLIKYMRFKLKKVGRDNQCRGSCDSWLDPGQGHKSACFAKNSTLSRGRGYIDLPNVGVFQSNVPKSSVRLGHGTT